MIITDECRGDGASVLGFDDLCRALSYHHGNMGQGRARQQYYLSIPPLLQPPPPCAGAVPRLHGDDNGLDVVDVAEGDADPVDGAQPGIHWVAGVEAAGRPFAEELQGPDRGQRIDEGVQLVGLHGRRWVIFGG